MSKDFNQIIPSIPSPREEIFAIHQVTRQFYHEVKHRQELKDYCDWYYSVAETNRQELAKMQNDINILGWFVRFNQSA